MRLKQRISAMERKSGIGDDVDIFMRRTIYEAKDGGIDSECFQASIGHPKRADSYFCIRSTDGETKDEFVSRVRAATLSAFGSLPHDWEKVSR